MQGRSIGRHFVASVLQTTFHRSPEGRIVIDNVHKPRQGSLLWQLFNLRNLCRKPVAGGQQAVFELRQKRDGLVTVRRTVPLRNRFAGSFGGRDLVRGPRYRPCRGYLVRANTWLQLRGGGASYGAPAVGADLDMVLQRDRGSHRSFCYSRWSIVTPTSCEAGASLYDQSFLGGFGAAVSIRAFHFPSTLT